MNTTIIAEIGINHNGDVNLAKKIIDAAKNSGVDGIKFQTYEPNLRFKKDNPFIKIFKDSHIKFDDEIELWDYAKKKKLKVLTTPFDSPSVENCKKFPLDGVKIASFETTNLKLVNHIGDLGLKTFFATGQNSFQEVKNVIKILKNKAKNIIPMHCISSYPMKVEDANLLVINKLKQENTEVGFSDHSEGHLLAGLAVAMGVKYIEKHFTLDNTLEGPDHSFSMNPKKMKKLVEHVRLVENSMGSPWMGVRESEKFIFDNCRRISNID